ncbi:hypothetical protein K1719_041842 [Acacia pycnantha]|nr:hypothetical protein K1719_041842 [Acacia pycnantha]
MTLPFQNSKQASSTLSAMPKARASTVPHSPTYVTSNNFDTLTNPVRTLAGDKPGRVDLNVTSYGGSVNISSGVAGKVLLPLDFYASNTPAAAPALAPAAAGAKAPKADKALPPSSEDSSDSSQVTPSKEDSGDVRLISFNGMWVSLGVAFIAVLTA